MLGYNRSSQQGRARMEPGSSPAASESRPGPGGWRQGVRVSTLHWSLVARTWGLSVTWGNETRDRGPYPRSQAQLSPYLSACHPCWLLQLLISLASCLCLASFVTHSPGPVTLSVDAFAVMTSCSHHCWSKFGRSLSFTPSKVRHFVFITFCVCFLLPQTTKCWLPRVEPFLNSEEKICVLKLLFGNCSRFPSTIVINGARVWNLRRSASC